MADTQEPAAAAARYARMVTSELVTEGHPDKLCDQVSDAILDAFLARDSNARVACETVAAGNAVWVHGEISSIADVDIESVVRSVIHDIGYTDSRLRPRRRHLRGPGGHPTPGARDRRYGDQGRHRRPLRCCGRRGPGDDVRVCVR